MLRRSITSGYPFIQELIFREEESHILETLLIKEFEDLFSKKGINLETLYEDVRKIVISGFAKKVKSSDLEDIIQEIYKGILIRNKGICPFDSNKSSFGSYVYMVSGCIIANYYQKKRKHPHFHEISDNTFNYYNPESGKTGETIDTLLLRDKLEEYLFLNLEKTSENKEIWDKIIRGYKLSEISRESEIPISRVSKKVKKIKQICAQWSETHKMSFHIPKKFQLRNEEKTWH